MESSENSLQPGDAACPGSLGGLRFEDFLVATSDCALIVDERWHVVFANCRAVEQLQAGSLEGAAFRDAFPELIGSTLESHCSEAMRQGSAALVEACWQRAGAWYDVQLVPMAGKLALLLRDVTARRLAAHASEERQRQLDALLNQAFVGMVQRDPEGRVIAVNDHYCRLLGRTPGELDGCPMEAFTHPGDVDWYAALYRDRLRTGEPFQVEKRYVRPDGGTVWCLVSVSFVKDDDGAVASVLIVAKDLTARREAERLAADAQGLLQTVVDSVSDLIFVKDRDGRFVLTNKALDEGLGPLRGQRVEDRLPADLVAGYVAEDRYVMATGRASAVEEQIPIGGELRSFQTIKVPWRRDGAIGGVIGISRDVTDRLAAEQALRDREERYRLAAKATDDAIWDWDLRSDLVDWNEAISQLAGERPTPTADWWRDRIHPEDQARVLDTIDALFAGRGENLHVEYRFRRADGSYAHVLDRGYMLWDDRRPVRMVGAITDMTERQAAEQALRESEERYRFTIELSHQVQWTADPGGRAVEMGAQWTELTGLDQTSALGDGWTKALHPDDYAATLAHWSSSLRTGEALDICHRLRRPDGSYHWCRVRAAPRRDDSGGIIRWYGIIEDIHDKVSADERLRQLQAELIHVSRVSAMGTMASALSHELNQPLTAATNLLGAAKQILSSGKDGGPDVSEVLDMASEQTLRAGEIIRRLRKLVVHGRLSQEAVELCPLIEEAIFIARTAAHSTAGCTITIDRAMPWVFADPVQVQQVVINIVRNALEALADAPIREISITAQPRGRDVEVCIEDTGPGVPDEARERLFSAFNSGKAGGLGVGLSISRTIIEAHGGRIWMEAPPGGGARFCFTLPSFTNM